MAKTGSQERSQKIFRYIEKTLDKFLPLCYLTITKSTKNISANRGTAKMGVDPARRIQYNVL